MYNQFDKRGANPPGQSGAHRVPNITLPSAVVLESDGGHPGFYLNQRPFSERESESESESESEREKERETFLSYPYLMAGGGPYGAQGLATCFHSQES